MIAEEQIILRLAVAASLGALVGADRERRERAAGLRTHALVGVGACLFMLVSSFGFGDVVGENGVTLDPSRVAAQVVSGIGFLGAGAIIVRRDSVRGLTTAASVWVSAAVGLAIGGGLFIAGGATTALTLLVLAALKPIERWFFKRPLMLAVVVGPDMPSVATLRAAAEDTGLAVEQVDVRPGRGGHTQVRMSLGQRTPERDTAVVDRLRALPGVRRVKLRSS
ncbi:MAG: MgtC/SapB family protein [bacterium]|nr:MgtC/SapB family protein [bacterium]